MLMADLVGDSMDILELYKFVHMGRSLELGSQNDWTQLYIA